MQFPHHFREPKYCSRTQRSLDLTFPQILVQTPVFVHRHRILQVRVTSIYIYPAKQLCQEPRLWRIKHPQPAASNPWDEQAQCLSDLSPFPWTPKPPPAGYNLPPWAMLETKLKLLTLKSQKKKRVPELGAPTQLCSGTLLSQPCSEGPQTAVTARCHPVPATRRVSPSLADRWPGQTLEGAGERLPWISAGAGQKPRWISSATTPFPATELLRHSLSPWFLKYCWYQKVNTLQNYCLPITRASSHVLLHSLPSH